MNLDYSPEYLAKIATREELASRLEAVRRAGQKIVFTNGCFDLIHTGHTRYLAQAAALGDFLILGLNSDDSVRRLKGAERPIRNQDHRAEVLAALEMIDLVVIFEEDTPLNLILAARPDILVKGGDWAVEDIVGGPEVVADGGRVFSLDLIPKESTTAIIDLIRTC